MTDRGINNVGAKCLGRGLSKSAFAVGKAMDMVLAVSILKLTEEGKNNPIFTADAGKTVKLPGFAVVEWVKQPLCSRHKLGWTFPHMSCGYLEMTQWSIELLRGCNPMPYWSH